MPCLQVQYLRNEWEFIWDCLDLQASGGVRSILKPSSAGAAIGFFSKESPVLITSRNLKYVKKDKRFDFKTDVRIWQDKNLIAAKDIEIGEENGEVSGRGAVKAVFVRPAKGRGGEEERLEIASDRMSYSPKDRQIAFTGNASLVTPELRLTAAGLAIYLSEKGNEMERLLAKGKVVIVQTGREGSGENADYDFSADTLVLTGKQVILIDLFVTKEMDKCVCLSVREVHPSGWQLGWSCHPP